MTIKPSEREYINDQFSAAISAAELRGYQRGVEDAAKVCEGHLGRKQPLPTRTFQTDEIWEGLLNCVRDEQRGERIASEILLERIRALSKPESN